MKIKYKYLARAAFAFCLLTSQIVLASASASASASDSAKEENTEGFDEQDAVKQLPVSTLSDDLSFMDVSGKSNEDLVHLSQQSIAVEDLCRQTLVDEYKGTATRTSKIFKHLLDATIPNAIRNASAPKNIDVVAIETLLLTLNRVVTPVFNESVLPALLEKGPKEATSDNYTCSEYYGRKWNGKYFRADNLYTFNIDQNSYIYPLGGQDASKWVKDTWRKNDSDKKCDNLAMKQFFDFWADHLDSGYKDSIHLLTGRQLEEWSEYAKECAKRNPNGKA